MVSRVKHRPVLIILAIVMLVFLTLGALAFWQINAMINPVSISSQDEKDIYIPYNSSVRQIALILEEENIIANAFLFRLYFRYLSDGQVFQAGHYKMTPGMPFENVVEVLQQGMVLRDGIRFTIPEGYNIEQIAKKLADENIIHEQVFLKASVQFNDTEHFPFLEFVPDTTRYKLEGYLFPDTYEIYEGTSAEDIITIMLSRLKEVYNQDALERLDELDLTMHESLTLASIVEKEGKSAEERPLIAAVFHNRLAKDTMPLMQSCATVQYAIGEVKPVLTYQDLAYDSPYNTYLNPDLPPGPIASPGFLSIEATLYPADVDYLYFVYKEDGSGTHYFSKTLQEHNENKRKAQRNRGR